jgi:hypothetical protein
VFFIPQTQRHNINTSHKGTAKLNYTNEVIRASRPLDINAQKHVCTVWLCMPKSLQKLLWTGVIITAAFSYSLHWSAEHDWTETEMRWKAPIRLIKMELLLQSSSLYYSLACNDSSSMEAAYKLSSLRKTGKIL